jgi:hypothetical protein
VKDKNIKKEKDRNVKKENDRNIKKEKDRHIKKERENSEKTNVCTYVSEIFNQGSKRWL